MSHPYLSFSDSSYASPGKVVGTSDFSSNGNGLSDKSVVTIEIPSSFNGIKVTEIGRCSFYGTSIISIYIPKTIQFIGYYAISYCDKLVDVIFEADSELKKMERNVFQMDNLLTKIDIPPSLEELVNDNNNYLFWGVTSLTCFSYFGSTDFSTSYVFKNTPEVHVSDSMYPKGKQFGKRDVIRDGKSCGVSNFKTKSSKCRYSIIVRDHYPNLTKLSIFLLISW